MTDSTFSLILLILTLVSFLVTLADIFWLSKKNREEEFVSASDKSDKKKQTGWVATIRSLFPILLIVLIIRSFIFAPFKIPSGSMIPTLKVGDYILVSKYQYGLRFPFFGTKIIPIDEPKRGDVVVFSSTAEFATQNKGKKEDLIKRLVGLPGDHIRYEGKNLYINDKLVSKTFVANQVGDYDPLLGGVYSYNIYKETLGKHTFNVQNYPAVKGTSGSWVVPSNMYFMMGDNRDLSDDSRYWKFVPEKNIIGKAVVVWMHWKSWSTLPDLSKARAIK